MDGGGKDARGIIGSPEFLRAIVADGSRHVTLRARFEIFEALDSAYDGASGKNKKLVHAATHALAGTARRSSGSLGETDPPAETFRHQLGCFNLYGLRGKRYGSIPTRSRHYFPYKSV
jgi:hypothetical protein